MHVKTLNPNQLGTAEDWEGNNIAVTCPCCAKVYIVSEQIHGGERPCPKCGQSRGMVKGGRKSGGTASIHTPVSTPSIADITAQILEDSPALIAVSRLSKTLDTERFERLLRVVDNLNAALGDGENIPRKVIGTLVQVASMFRMDASDSEAGMQLSKAAHELEGRMIKLLLPQS